MNDIAARLVALGAAVLAAVALAVSLTHHGPAGATGPAGPRGATGQAGQAGKAATAARLGICWQAQQTNGNGAVWVQYVSIDPAQLSDGVYQCPSGEQFVSIVPTPQKTQ